MKAGLHRYFKIYEWGNTTLPDFVGCLQWAWDESKNTSMGDDFNFTDWCDTWLKSSGVNILEPEVDFNEDSSIKTLSIKQSCDLRGKNRLRKQKINLAVYDNDMVPHVIMDVVLSDKDAVNPVIVDFKGPVKAIIINHDDHGYCKIRFDQRSLDSLEKEMFKITDHVTRGLVWRNLWLLT